jgi:hypothetical protein
MKKFTLVNQVTLSVLLFSPFLCGADLSTYPGFQFGMSLSAAARHSGMDVSEVTTLHQPLLDAACQITPNLFLLAHCTKKALLHVPYHSF